MVSRGIWTVLTLILGLAASAAQTPDPEFEPPSAARGAVFEDVEGFELQRDYDSPDPQPVTTCRYFQVEDGSFEESCGTTEYTAGAVEVPKWSVPYQVQLISNPDGESDDLLRRSFPSLKLWQARHICSGALIDKNWVLTAAHCIDKNMAPQGYGVRLKADSISENLDDYIEVEKYIIHPDYESGPLENDIALLKLSEQGEPRKFERYSPGVGTGKMPYWRAYLSADGKRVITQAQATKTSDFFAVWNAETGEKIYAHKKGDALIRTATFEEDPGLIYGVDHMGAWVFDMQNDHQIRRIAGTDRTHRINFLKAVNHLATWSRDNKVTVWDQHRLSVIDSFHADVELSGISNIGKNIYGLFNETGQARVFNTETGTSLYTGQGMGNILAADGKQFTEIEGQSIISRRTQDGKVLKSLPMDAPISAAWRSGDYLIVDAEPTLNIIDPNTLETKLRLPVNKYQILNVSGDKAVTLTSGNAFSFFKLGSRRPIGEVIVPEAYAKAGQWTLLDNDRKFLMWLPQGKSKVWNVKNGKLLYEINHSLPVANVEVSDDQKYLISYSEFGPTDIWSVKNGKAVNRIFHRGVQGVTFNSAHEKLLTRDNRGIARVWSLNSAEKLAEIDIKPPSAYYNFYPEVATIALAQTEPEDGTQLWAFGWGKTREVAKLEPVSVLRGVTFSKISDETCREKFKSARLELGDDEVCAFDEARKTCKGDSGGPIATFNALVGVTSWGARSCSEDKKQPSVMASVAYFRKWIQDTACDNQAPVNRQPEFCEN